MFKVIQLLKKKPEVSVEDFEKQVTGTYVKTMKKVKGLRSFVLNTVTGVHGAEEKPLDYIAELAFTSEKAFNKALEDPNVQATLDELGRVVEEPRFIYSKEKVLKRPKAAAKKPAKKAAKKAKRKATKKAGKARKRKK